METRNRAICYANRLRAVRQEDKTSGAQRKQIFHSLAYWGNNFITFLLFQENSTFTYPINTCIYWLFGPRTALRKYPVYVVSNCLEVTGLRPQFFLISYFSCRLSR